MSDSPIGEAHGVQTRGRSRFESGADSQPHHCVPDDRGWEGTFPGGVAPRVVVWPKRGPGRRCDALPGWGPSKVGCCDSR
jgi:hypothetical protein